MAPKKKPGATIHPSASRAPPPATANVAGNPGTRENVDAMADVVGTGGVGTTAPVAEVEPGGTGEGWHQQHPSGHAPRGTNRGIVFSTPFLLAEGHIYGGGARSGANRNPPAALVAGATAGHAPPPEQADPANAPSGVADPQ